MVNRRHLRREVRDAVLDYIDEHPTATAEQIDAAVTADLGDRGISPTMLAIMLEILKVLLPLILNLRKG